MSNDKNSRINWPLVLLILAVVCLAGAAVLTQMTRGSAAAAAPVDQLSFVIQRAPFEAQNALRGETSAFDALGKSAERLNTLTASGPLADARAKLGPDWNKLTSGIGDVGQARSAVEVIQASNQEVRDLAPKLLSALGDLASAGSVQKLDGMSRYLERFELTVQRVEQDMSGLALGVSDAAPAAQRLADSLEFLNQVVRGLSGEESGLALTRVTGADAEQRLKIVVQRNQEFANSVRKAIAAAQPLSKAQAAARALPALAGGLA